MLAVYGVGEAPDATPFRELLQCSMAVTMRIASKSESAKEENRIVLSIPWINNMEAFDIIAGASIPGIIICGAVVVAKHVLKKTLIYPEALIESLLNYRRTVALWFFFVASIVCPAGILFGVSGRVNELNIHDVVLALSALTIVYIVYVCYRICAAFLFIRAIVSIRDSGSNVACEVRKALLIEMNKMRHIYGFLARRRGLTYEQVWELVESANRE